MSTIPKLLDWMRAMVPSGLKTQASMKEFEESIVGKNGNPWINEQNESLASSLIAGLSITLAMVFTMESWREARIELNPVMGQPMGDADLLAIMYFLLAAFTYWVTISSIAVSYTHLTLPTILRV